MLKILTRLSWNFTKKVQNFWTWEQGYGVLYLKYKKVSVHQKWKCGFVACFKTTKSIFRE